MGLHSPGAKRAAPFISDAKKVQAVGLVGLGLKPYTARRAGATLGLVSMTEQGLGPPGPREGVFSAVGLQGASQPVKAFLFFVLCQV